MPNKMWPFSKARLLIVKKHFDLKCIYYNMSAGPHDPCVVTLLQHFIDINR